jgi:hypothetical protein
MTKPAILRTAFLLSAAMTMCATGGVSSPYSADEHTRLLYHFEEAPHDFEKAGDPGNPVSNSGSKGSTLSLTDTGGPDGRDNKGGGGYAAQGAPGMDHAFDVIASGDGSYHSTGSATGGGLRTAQPVPQADLQAANGAFTYEALVKLPDIARDRQIQFPHHCRRHACLLWRQWQPGCCRANPKLRRACLRAGRVVSRGGQL